VIEGLHGVPLDRPLSRMCETVEIVRQAASGEKVSHSGREFQIPLPGGDGKPMRLSMRAEYDIPVYLATLSPKMLHLTGDIADGWLGTGFVPESAKQAYFDHLDRGLANAGRTRADLDICQGAEVAFADDEDALRVMVADCNNELAFSLGGMGSATTNFYNNAYSRQGWAEVAAEVRERWQAGDRDGAAGLVTDEMVLATSLIGIEGMLWTEFVFVRCPRTTADWMAGARPMWAGVAVRSVRSVARRSRTSRLATTASGGHATSPMGACRSREVGGQAGRESWRTLCPP
jgi:alkanesulfonate monooxygenase SsuD/methylene tetrahydromethanopterin reductase-like flavin-dependent oxidoreductase (luciferase family)